jgi:hypothetical protein
VNKVGERGREGGRKEGRKERRKEKRKKYRDSKGRYQIKQRKKKE